ncbi:MAG: carbohydrate kinase family protein [Chloroflexi bacterium]|nr:carbohydrate kinase family protein [Chloroflexota bacterium]
MTHYPSQDLLTRPVCIIGNLCVDLIIRNVPAMPIWGQEVNGSSHVLVSSGQTGYTAFALSRLGILTSVVGSVGEDANGKQVIEDLKSYGIDTAGVITVHGGQTGISVAIVRDDGERAFVSTLGSSQDFNESMVLDQWDKPSEASIVCLVGLFNTPNLTLKSAARLLAKARQAHKLTMLDTGWDPHNWQADTIAGLQEILSQTTLFMPNFDEARAITGKNTPEEAALALQKFGTEIVVIKCGGEGSYCRQGDQTFFVQPRQVDVFDAVGAGDTFNAGFIFGLRHGWSWQACLAFGNTTASIYISRNTNRWPWLDEVVSTAKSSYPFIPEINP